MDHSIIAVHCRQLPSSTWECLVAIDAGNNYWKAYRHVYMEYPEWPQVVDTAKLGGKLPVLKAAETFPDLVDRFQNYGY
jgi:hypothetical protein